MKVFVGVRDGPGISSECPYFSGNHCNFEHITTGGIQSITKIFVGAFLA